MDSYTHLINEARACTLCKDVLPEKPRPVFQLHPEAKILLAGQAPGRKVHASGIPFTDASGDRLRDWMGISRETFYDAQQIAILPMGFCYPGTGKSGDLPPRPECAAKWRKPLLDQLQNISLTLVIGQYALAYHLPNAGKSVTEIVLNWRTYQPHIVPLPHPSPRNINWLKRNPWFEEELVPVLKRSVIEVLDGV